MNHGEPFAVPARLMIMGRALMDRTAAWCLLLCSALLWAPGVRAADFELTPAETARVNQGETVIRAELDSAQRRGTVRAAMLVNAAPEVVFQAMTSCADALKYVPHLRRCRVRPGPGETATRFVEHEIDFGWYAPKLSYVFQADVVTDRRIAFHQVRGDFRTNRGVWEFEPQPGNTARTLLRYRVEIDPPGYVPNWLARSTFRRELPLMLAQLKKHCEAEQGLRTHANNLPY
jgi:ribosome-associated toxin RatA of RatAB toxin-antitoxin module